MALTHFVLFAFKSEAESSEVKYVCDAMLGLKDNCIHLKLQKPYIVSMKGGKDNSHECLQDGITHAFVAEFDSASDCDYYVNEDPAHRAFAEKATGSSAVARVQVVDFRDGQFS